MDAGKYVVTWPSPGAFGESGPEVRRFKSADEMLRWLGRDWKYAKRPDGEEPMVWNVMFVSRREVRL